MRSIAFGFRFSDFSGLNNGYFIGYDFGFRFSDFFWVKQSDIS